MILGVQDSLVLSPMVDVTDAAFRSIARDQGADITCSEMVSAAGLVHDNATTWRHVQPYPGEAPYGVQLMSGDPEETAEAVRALAGHDITPEFVDINLGCPSPNILRACAGGFLLRDPPQAGRVMAAAKDACDDVGIPHMSAKMRMGHDHDHLTYLDVGQAAQDAGASWTTLHGRTVEQGYSGHADWDAIATLVGHLDIPVIGNGDLRTPDDVVRMKDHTSCAGFFIARAAMHDPTVFRRMRHALDGDDPEPAPDLATRIGLLRTYMDRADELAIAALKRQATRFVQGAPGAKALRKEIHGAKTTADLMVALTQATST